MSDLSKGPVKQLIQEVKLLNVSERTENQNIFKSIDIEALLGPTTLKKPVIFHWNSGKIETLYGSPEETGLVLNLKRGLVSLFQLQTGPGTITEVDVSGNCRVTYKTDNDQVTKIKDLHSCERPDFVFGASNRVLGVQWQPTCKGLYSVENGVIKAAVSEESHVVSLNLQSTVGAKISSRQHLLYLTSEERSVEISGKNLQEALDNLGVYTPFPLTGSLVKGPCKLCTPASDYFKSLNKNTDLQDVSQISTTRTFLAFVQLLREAKKVDILNVLKKAAATEISFLIDSVTATQTESSLSALSEYLDFTKETQISQQRTFLYASAFSSNPTKELLHILLAKLRGKIGSREIRETTISVIGAVIRKLCQRNLCNLQDVEVAKKVILDGLNAATEEADVKMYLLALKNALLPETVPLLLKYTEWQSSSVVAFAVTALQRFPSVYITQEVKKRMNRIFHQSSNRYGAGVRLAALDVILNNQPSDMELKNILLSVGEIESEPSKYITEKLQGILHSEHHPASSNEAERDDAEATAGMSMILFDVQLPPIVFFQGYTDLMEKAWSLTEEPISIIKGSILFIDHLQEILLQSGLQAATEFQGGLGIDISGSIELSLWSQKTKTNIRNRGTLVIHSVINVDTPFAQAGVNSSSEAAASLDFVSNVNFLDSPILICLQMLKKPFPYRETVTIYESLPKGAQFAIRKQRTLRVQGTELPLHRANSEMCKKLHSERA
ncbi:hypothetical protein scyTo_0008132 [Scyliorhinus torazame]|uniref:Vitellogenin domain-containing protein n=1 Tax=Scyliorhinus torazame TaxID=75743 RepID=A0A401P425_SCYTO|nr:hypothetical protein [Scyliorhinus torazame]